jgi:hypothetical protein
MVYNYFLVITKGGCNTDHTQWQGGSRERGKEEMSTVQKICTHAYKYKNNTCGNCPMNTGGEAVEGVNSGMI